MAQSASPGSRRGGFAFIAIVCLIAGASCVRVRPVNVGLDRARAHITMLAGTIGRRPVGSRGNARARDYIVDQLKQAGLAVRVQDADAVNDRAGVTTHVMNVIGFRGAPEDDAVALVAHYDSVPDGPGASDDALGVATCIESARLLLQQPLRHSLFVLITDGEELGLMGARAVVTDPAVKSHVKAFLNFDGTGASGPPLLFEAGPGWGTPLDAWAAGAEDPDGASFGVEIYKHLPNDTDFTILKTMGASGLNFAPVFDSYGYHTDRDVPARVSDETLRLEIVNTVAAVRELDTRVWSSRNETPTFFSVGDSAIVYGATATAAIAAAACLAGIAVWGWLTVVLVQNGGSRGLVLIGVRGLAAVVAPFVAMMLVVWLSRGIHGAMISPWYAAPYWFAAALGSAGGLAVVIVGVVARGLPDRVRPVCSPWATWWAALPLWILLTAMLAWRAPAASYLTAIPLLFAAVLLVFDLRPAGGPRPRVRLVSMVAGVVAFLWLNNIRTLVSFLVPVFGWLPIVAPGWVYPALVLVLGMMIVPPVLMDEHNGSSTSGRVWRVAVAVLFLVSFIGASAVAPYTHDRPQRDAARYVQDSLTRQAWWEIAGPEPRRDPDLPRFATPWLAVTDAPPASVRVGRIGPPFAWRAAAASLVPPPADVQSSWRPSPDGREILSIVVTPHAPLHARIVLPKDIVPAQSTLAGVVSAGRWSATYLAVPSTGLTLGLTFGGLPHEALKDTVVVLMTNDLPGSTEADPLPVWLHTSTSTWEARSVFVMSPW